MSFPPPQPTTTFPYRVEAKIGEGAMGVVYRAFETGLERPVAIKTLHPQILADEAPEVAREYRLRFLQEARAAAALAHPGATTIYRTGEEGGVPYIAMEWLEGRTLERLVREEGPLPPGLVVRLGRELLATLEVAHRAGVVHRDIKPANLVLLDDGRLKVTDFGIARILGSDMVKTQAGVVLATPFFASPEQLRAEEVDGRSDLFAVGVLLYFLASARYPFAGETFLQVANSIFRDAPVPLRSVAPGVPPGLAAAVERALAKSREGRFQSAAMMAAALGTAAAEPARQAAAVTAPAGAAVRSGLPTAPALAVAAVARSWEARALGRQPVRDLLDRLLDRPLHAAAFSGALMIDAACLLLADGLLAGAIDTVSGAAGDPVVDALPATGEAALHAAPAELAAAGVRALASLLHSPRRRHEGLDSAYVNLPALAGKLEAEGFDGALRFERPGSPDVGFVLFCQGRQALRLFSAGWDGVPVERPWEDWVGGLPLRASVEETRLVPCYLSFRRELHDAEVEVLPAAQNGAARGTAPATARTLRQRAAEEAAAPGVPALALAAPLAAKLEAGLGLDATSDPIYRFLHFCLAGIPPFLRERDRAERWKYLVDWLADVRRARLHHDLPRPGSGESDFFDLVTFDAGGRVLHLAHRLEHVTFADFEEFRGRVIQAKTARIKSGDIGAALLVARGFEPEALAARAEAPATSGRWKLGIEETFTGYEGFVRVGPRRGFHLMLVQETDSGFEPLLP